MSVQQVLKLIGGAVALITDCDKEFQSFITLTEKRMILEDSLCGFCNFILWPLVIDIVEGEKILYSLNHSGYESIDTKAANHLFVFNAEAMVDLEQMFPMFIQ